ncbi:MAG: magnesium transporter [Kosmotoga sp.]|nr:MAG: magnesium transporter [Kosmotoga sp.]
MNIFEKVDKLINEKKWKQLSKLITEIPAPEVADLLLELDKKQRVIVFRIIPRQFAAEVFSYLEPYERDELLLDLTDNETRELLSNLKPDDRTALFRELPGQVTQRLMNLLNPEDLDEAKQLLGYPEESIGRLMTPDYVAVRPDWTIGKALEHIRTIGRDSETINVIYIVDQNWKLLDVLELRKFIIANPDQKVSEIMDYRYISIVAFEDQEDAVKLIQIYDLFALPVVDTNGILLGIVTVDDVFDVAEQETTEDFQLTAAVRPLKTSYHYSSIWSLFTKRIGWLMILVLVNLISSGVISAFEKTLSSAIALAFFIPLLIDSGGNAGAQSATLMVRAIATGDVKMSRWFITILKELAIGAALGVTMGLASWLLGFVRGGVEIGFVVSLSMVSIIVVANLIGAILPFILTKLKMDPAVASSPLITTIVDGLGLLIYFTLATILIPII